MLGYTAGNLAGALILLEDVEEAIFCIVNTSIIYMTVGVEKTYLQSFASIRLCKKPTFIYSIISRQAARTQNSEFSKNQAANCMVTVFLRKEAYK